MEPNKENVLGEITGYDPKCNRHYQIPILYHDKDFLIVNKPFDLRIDGDPKEKETEESLILSKFPEYKGKLKLIHQLDYATSGIHCWGLNKNAARKATRSFRQHRVRKTYLAIVRGFIKEDKFEIEKPIAKDPNHERKMMIGTEENPGKEAKTLVEVIKRGIFHPIPDENPISDSKEGNDKKVAKNIGMEATLVKLHPYTGRTHQLRVHLNSIGHPIISDYNYEVPFTDHQRMMLHAWKIYLPLTPLKKNDPKNKAFLEKRNNNKKLKIENAQNNNNVDNNIDSNKNVDQKDTQNNNEIEEIILETVNPFENLLSDN